MFGLIRLPILLLIAFIVGVFFERNNQREACEGLGEWRNGICLTTGAANE
ncbi:MULTISPECIES: hypothetical protein [unclassified Ruegeria]|nr:MULTISPECIES: hypothetical protein [unclassified Ruegeria]MCX8953783.1 hypothetical protein [Ruegeria sp. NA]